MDKDQAVKHLRLKADLLAEHDGNEHSSKNYRAIAALIEQQAEQIESMRNCDNCKNLNNCCGYEDNDFLDCNNYERWEWEG